MSRRVIEPGPLTFAELRRDHQSAKDTDTSRKVIEKFVGDADALRFQLLSIPTFQPIESTIVEAVVTKRLTPEMFDYVAWRERGAQERPIRELYAMIDNARRSVPGWEADKTRVEELEALYAEGADVDPLIAKGLGVPLSSKDEALFMLDGRHRLFAAVAAGPGELPVYVLMPA